jgi:hypothetical protein
MSAYSPTAGINPTVPGDDELPPQELTWDSTILDLLKNSYSFSDDLIDLSKPPRFIRLYADRWQVNWQESGVGEPENQTVVDLFITVRPIAPAEITIRIV